MKKLVYYISILSLVCTSVTVMAQGDQILNRFDALAIDGQVQLTCIISSGNTCAGIEVYRSHDNIHFELIGDIPGICGSTVAPVQYDFIDEQPLINKTSYYKLELGGVGFTEVITVTIRDLGDQEVRIQPNPAQNTTTIYFNNSSFTTHTLNIWSYNGESILEVSTTNDFFIVDVTYLASGVYPIIITNKSYDTSNSGMLVVQH